MAVKKRYTRTGKVRYAASWRDPTTGRHIERRFPTKREAREYDEDRKTQGDTPLATSTTIDQLYRRYKKTHYPSLALKTRTFYDTQYEKRIKPTLGTKRLSWLTTLRITEWRNELDGGIPSKNAALRVLKAMLGQAVAWGVLPQNPAKGVKPLKVERDAKPRVLTATQVEKIRSHLTLDTDKALVALLYGSGLRIGEACCLQWKDVEERHVNVVAAFDEDGALKAPKSYAHRRVPLLKDARTALEEWRPHAHPVWVFARQDGEGPIRPDTFRNRWETARKKAKLPTARIHDLRHSYTSVLVSKGIDVRTVQAALGHSSPVTTMRIYAHLVDDDDAVFAKLDG